MPRVTTADRGILHTLILAVLCFASYATYFRHPIPVHPDEAAFMEGVGFPDHYPVHHPGYPLWVLMGTAGRFLGMDAYEAFSIWSLAAAVVSVALCHRLFRKLMSANVAFLFAAAFGVNPLAWFSSVTALTYSMAAAIGLAVVLLSVRSVLEKRPGLAMWGAVILAVGIMVRTDLLIYTGPVLLAAVLRHRSAILFIRTAAIVVTGCVIFLLTVHTIYGRGDPEEVAGRAAHTMDVLLNTSIFRAGFKDGLVRNSVKMAANLGWQLGIALLFFVGMIPAAWRRARGGDFGARLVVTWLLPGLVFLMCLHVVQGYFLVLLPAFYLAVGRMAETTRGIAVARRIGAIVVVATVLQFMAYPWSSTSTGFKRMLDAKITYLSRIGLKHADERVRIDEDGDVWRIPAHDLNRPADDR